jgi:hypothetical protein
LKITHHQGKATVMLDKNLPVNGKKMLNSIEKLGIAIII